MNSIVEKKGDFWLGVVWGTILCVGFYVVFSIAITSGKRDMRDDCTAYGKTEIGGMKYECSIKVARP